MVIFMNFRSIKFFFKHFLYFIIHEKIQYSFVDFHPESKMVSDEWKAAEPEEEAADNMLRNMEPEAFGKTLRILQDSVDDDYFGTFFRELMTRMHKIPPKFKVLVHEDYGSPWVRDN